MALSAELKEYFGDEAIQYIPQILKGEIGRHKLAKKLDCSNHKARHIIDIVSRYDSDENWTRIAEDNQLRDAFPGLAEHCAQQGIPVESVAHFWHKTKKYSLFSKPSMASSQNFYRVFDDIVKRHAEGETVPFERKPVTEHKALKATITDAHVGLEPNPDDNGLFQYAYDAGSYKESINKVFNSIMKEHSVHGRFDLLLLDDLGDREDGWNGQTERGGHDLPQNMSNVEIFNTCVDTTVSLIRRLIKEGVANKYILRSCVNSNHSGDFAEIVNNAVKKCIGMIYDEDVVEVQSLKRFLEHRFYGDHCFILTHGKDKDNRFRGLPLKLNDKTSEFVRDYIDHYELRREARYIHLEKGDLHQLGYDKHKQFDYRNFMSFAPPSNWLQSNFGDSYAGYSIQVIPKFSNEISHTDYFLDYKKKSLNRSKMSLN